MIDLPKELYGRSRSLMSNSGEVYRMFLRENEVTNGVLQRAGKTKDLGSLPVPVFHCCRTASRIPKRERQKEKELI